jgi:hypothetical protein
MDDTQKILDVLERMKRKMVEAEIEADKEAKAQELYDLFANGVYVDGTNTTHVNPWITTTATNTTQWTYVPSGSTVYSGEDLASSTYLTTGYWDNSLGWVK